VAQSFRSLVLDQAGSTNREAFALAEAGETGPLWIMARRQTAGRGRADRQWLSVPGNLHASLLMELDCPPTAVPQLSLLAGVATLDAIRQAAAGELAGLRLKWPNDILIGQAKCAGILVETSASLTRHSGPSEAHLPRQRQPDSPPPCGEGLGVGGLSARRYLFTAVIGIGIDLAWHPTAMHRAATDLAAHGCRISPETMLASLAEAMRRWLAVWDNGRGFHNIRQAWLERAGPMGEMCTVDTGRERIEGAFADLDPDGALVIRDSHGQRRTVTFGDVALDAAPAGPAPPEAPQDVS
jgi:BirA family transcriptional regulator, biotin operon repressor / biotin---[acetyl-CoA-carboxylase] ligase